MSGITLLCYAAVYGDIRVAVDNLLEAYNSGNLDVEKFYTEDCVLAVPGREPLIGRKGGVMHVHVSLLYFI